MIQPHRTLCIVLTGALCAASFSCARKTERITPPYIGPERPLAGHATPPVLPVQPSDRVLLHPSVPEPPPPPATPLALSVTDAILMGLENNQQLSVQRLTPLIRETAVAQARSIFDPVIGATVARSFDRFERRTTGGGKENVRTDSTTGSGDVSVFLPTGTTLALEADAFDATTRTGADPLAEARLGVSITQSLLRGFGLGANLAAVRQARLDLRISESELRGFTESLVAEIESTYWDYALAERRIAIFENSLRLAEQQMRETQDRIEVGTLARTELAAAQAEVARRREALINTRSALETVRLRLLRLVNPQDWSRERDIALRDQPHVPPMDETSIEQHLVLARMWRPELTQARMAVQRNALDVVRTRNGLLPRMDLFVTLGRSGYADSFGPATRNLDDSNYDTQFGVRFEYPLGNRAAEAAERGAVIIRRQSEEALSNLAQLVELDVREAYIDMKRAREQVAATAATRALQEESLRAETEKFQVGRSTSLLVAQAQRDLVESELAEVQSVVNHLKAIIDLYRLEGTLLMRRGIRAPMGMEGMNSLPVDVEASVWPF